MKVEGLMEYGVLRAIYDNSIDVDTKELGLLNIKIDQSLDAKQLVLNREYIFICSASYERFSGNRYDLIIKDIVK